MLAESQRLDCGVVGYINDIVLLARTRWELRRAIAALHEEIAAARFTPSPREALHWVHHAGV
jgi:hypothetical protein